MTPVFLCLAALAWVAPPDVPVHDLAYLTLPDAARLDGKRSRFLVTIAGPSDGRKIGDVYRDEYECQPMNDPQGVLELEPGDEVRGRVVVNATLRVIRHKEVAVLGAARLAPFVEYRLEDAKLR